MEQNQGIINGIPCGTFVTTLYGDHIHTPWDETDLFDFEHMAGLVDHFAEMVLWLSHSTTTSTGPIPVSKGFSSE